MYTQNDARAFEIYKKEIKEKYSKLRKVKRQFGQMILFFVLMRISSQYFIQTTNNN